MFANRVYLPIKVVNHDGIKVNSGAVKLFVNSFPRSQTNISVKWVSASPRLGSRRGGEEGGSGGIRVPLGMGGSGGDCAIL